MKQIPRPIYQQFFFNFFPKKTARLNSNFLGFSKGTIGYGLIEKYGLHRKTRFIMFSVVVKLKFEIFACL